MNCKNKGIQNINETTVDCIGMTEGNDRIKQTPFSPFEKYITINKKWKEEWKKLKMDTGKTSFCEWKPDFTGSQSTAVWQIAEFVKKQMMSNEKNLFDQLIFKEEYYKKFADRK